MSSNSSEDEVIASAFLLMAAAIKTKKKRKQKERKKRVVWVKPWLQRRSTHGIFATLVEELRREDLSDYTNYFRMSPSEFDEMFARVENKITKKDTRMREAIINAYTLNCVQME